MNDRIISTALLLLVIYLTLYTVSVDSFAAPGFENQHNSIYHSQQRLRRKCNSLGRLLPLHQLQSSTAKYVPNADIWPPTTNDPNNDVQLSIQDCFPNGIVPSIMYNNDDDDNSTTTMIRHQWRYTMQSMFTKPIIVTETDVLQSNMRRWSQIAMFFYSTFLLLLKANSTRMILLQDVFLGGVLPMVYVFVIQEIVKYPIFPPWFSEAINSNNPKKGSNQITPKSLSLLPSTIIHPLSSSDTFHRTKQYRQWVMMGYIITRMIPFFLSSLYTILIPGGIQIGSIWLLRYVLITSTLDFTNTIVNHSIYGIRNISLPIRGLYTLLQSIFTIFYTYQWTVNTYSSTLTNLSRTGTRSILHLMLYKNTFLLSFVVSVSNLIYNVIQCLCVVLPIQLLQYYRVYFTMIQAKYVEFHE